MEDAHLGDLDFTTIRSPRTTQATSAEDETAAATRSDESSAKRRRVEDNTPPGWPEGACIFGVFDGHGGKGVAKFVAKHLSEHLHATWREGVELEKALYGAFLNLDQALISPDGRLEVRDLCREPNIAPNSPIRAPKELVHLMFRQQGEEIPASFTESDSHEGFLELDDSIMQLEATPESQGCTAVVVVYLPPTEDAPYGTLVTANCGDSRAVLCRGTEAIALTEDHKPEMACEKERIEKAGGTVSIMPAGDQRVCGVLNLTRAFGDYRFKKNGFIPQAEQIITCAPDVERHVLTKDDTFVVLASDGIWEKRGNQQVVDNINQKNIKDVAADQLSTISEALCDENVCPSMEGPGFDGTGCDNMTVILVRLPKTT